VPERLLEGRPAGERRDLDRDLGGEHRRGRAPARPNSPSGDESSTWPRAARSLPSGLVQPTSSTSSEAGWSSGTVSRRPAPAEGIARAARPHEEGVGLLLHVLDDLLADAQRAALGEARGALDAQLELLAVAADALDLPAVRGHVLDQARRERAPPARHAVDEQRELAVARAADLRRDVVGHTRQQRQPVVEGVADLAARRRVALRASRPRSRGCPCRRRAG
jgi:hypothetical protein